MNRILTVVMLAGGLAGSGCSKPASPPKTGPFAPTVSQPVKQDKPVCTSELKIAVNVNGKLTAEVLLKIEGDIATATVAGETEQFDLKEMRWLDPKAGQWVTVAQCKQWAEQSKAKSLKSAGAAPSNVRSFVLWSFEPEFKAEKSNDALRLTSGQVDYVIEGEASKTEADKYFRYAILNAYKKAMTERKLPPFAELKAIDEMMSLGRIPRKISVTTPGIPGAPSFGLEITETQPSG